jgi:diacylglycerol kinase (ATP)
MIRQRVTLVHNASAGEGEWPPERLVGALAAAGFDVADDRSVGDMESLEGVRGLVVARVAIALRDAEAVLAIVPTGGANNIAATFGVPRDPARSLADLERGRRSALHIGRLEGASGDRLFVESVGLGPIARAAWRMPQDGISREEKRTCGRAVIAAAVQAAEPVRAAATIDGEPLREAALMIEVMNIALVGPSLRLAPEADPADRDLVVAWLPLDSREAMIAWLESPEAGPPPMCWRRGRRVEIHVAGDAVRIDDDLLKVVRGEIRLELLPRPLPVLLP